MKILVANLGSTSLKMKLLEMDTERLMAEFHLERIGSNYSTMIYRAAGSDAIQGEISAPSYEKAIRYVLDLFIDEKDGCLDSFDDLDGIGFKSVHAGDFYGPALVNDEVIELMRCYSQAAPSHNPVYIEAMQILRDTLPDIPQVAVFENSLSSHNTRLRLDLQRSIRVVSEIRDTALWISWRIIPVPGRTRTSNIRQI